MDTSRVTRFEVIENSSRYGPGTALVRYGVSVELALQDGGRTLKVFLADSSVSEQQVLDQIRDGLKYPAAR